MDTGSVDILHRQNAVAALPSGIAQCLKNMDLHTNKSDFFSGLDQDYRRSRCWSG